ncbi:hypothetical protein JL108_10655 [Aeromicrobium sp. YIM 150415]|uniref:hypothetical protein n=1 Tax=Aeromicrobium sp. YIM 150415 TaxID=2803912 RepID=UPI001966A802|nr:hypothetical protein [Aeromicrobium sp. YIM 150415]MBM9463906.1 hypothetical protein [Aeromicrobium sp. YIM 150415]
MSLLPATLVSSAERVCTVAVPSRPGGPTGEVPVTGVIPGTGAGVVAVLLIVAGALIVFGLLLRRRGRRDRLAALALVPVAVLTSTLLTPPTPASAAGCDLITTSGIERPAAQGLLPGQRATVLQYEVRNVSEVPIALEVGTELTSGDDLAGQLETEVVVAGVAGDRAPLASGPAAPTSRLAPGERVAISYTVVLAEDSDLAGAVATFDSLLTARSR